MKTSELNECDRLFEALSAWIDGEASPEEALAVQAHLATCDGCRHTEAALRELAICAPTAPMPEIPLEFAARTRKLVEERTERAWDVRLRRLGRRVSSWVDDLVPAPQSLARALGSDPRLVLQGAAASAFGAASAAATALPVRDREASPIAALLQTRSERAGLKPPSFWLKLVLGLYGGPALLLTLLGEGDSAANYLFWVGVGLLVALPWYHFRTDLAILVSLRRGRCLEEILGTALDARSLCDALASFSLRSLYRVGLPVALLLAASVPLYQAEFEPLAATAAAAWLPLLGIVFAVGSYATQAITLFARGGERPGAASVGIALLLFAPVVALGVAGGSSSAPYLALSLGLLGGALWVGLVGRAVAIWGLQHPAVLERWSRPTAPRRNRWVRAWSDNPIVAREMARLSAAIPLGLLGLFLARLIPAAIPAQATWGLCELAPEWWSLAFWLGAALLGWIAYMRAAARTSASLASEQEGSTLEAMVQSGLTRRDFVSGWLQVACAPIYLELAVSAALIAAIALTIPEALSGWSEGVAGTLDLGAAALVIVALAAMPLAGAWAGLAVSAVSPNRREAGARAVATVVRSVAVWVVVWGMATAALTAATVLLHLQFESGSWRALVACVLPAATLALTVLGLTWSSRKEVERHLATRWNDLSIVAVVTPRSGSGRLRAVILGPALLAGGLVSAQLGLFLSVLVAAPGSDVPQSLAWIVSGLAASAAIALAGWWLSRPVLSALADHAGCSPWSSAFMAGLSGAVAGGTLATLPLVVRVCVEMGLVQPDQPETALMTPVLWGAGLGFVVAATGAALGALAWPPLEAQRAMPFLERVRLAGGPASRQVLLLGAALLVVGALLAGVLVRGAMEVPIEEPVLAQDLWDQATRREQARAQVPPDQNGFTLLEPVFMSRRLELAQIGMARRYSQLADGFRALAWAEKGTREDNLKAVRENPARTREAAAKLDASLPALREALRRPEFITPPRWSEGPSALVPNYILMRALAQSLRVRAMLHEEEGHLGAALEAHLLNLEWAERSAGHGVLIQGMISIAITAIADEGLLGFLQRHRLSEADYRRILAFLDGSRFTPDYFRRVVDDEFCFGQRAFQLARQGGVGELDPALNFLMVLPGPYLERERRVYVNEFLRARRDGLNGRRHAYFDSSFGDGGLGELSLAALLMPNMNRAFFQSRYAFSRRNALRAVCLLELHRLRSGRYPATLEEVWKPGPIETQDPVGGGTFLYRLTGDGFVLQSSSAELRQLGNDADRDGVHDWRSETAF